MKKFILISLVFSISCAVTAQTGGNVAHTIKGKVVNSVTNEPVSYTNIGLEGTFYGTASNAEGDFELKIPQDFAAKNIYFSAVGFKNKKFPVAQLFKKEYFVIKLEAQSYGINDVDVAAQSKVLIRILRMAAENIPVNFIGGPLNLQCSYENEKITDDTISTSQKASVVIFDQSGYANPSITDAFRSRNYSLTKTDEPAEDYRFSTGTTNLDELLELDWVRSASLVLNPDLLPGFKLRLEDEPTINGSACWVISFTQPAPSLAGSGDFYATSFEGKITIEKDDYSVKKIEGRVQSPKNNRQGRSLAIGKTNSNFLENVSYNFAVNYSNLKPDIFLLEKNYLSEGKKVSEKSKLTVKQVQTTQVKEIEGREYFTGN
ncbi:MAG: carboxypeptidase-like regulatory domain-containing protein [Prolixibacteraceae bacterium]|nr:carboxypeptidase-like regulatory domain-containing protein [Prolixibacteraceae bacterium]